MTNTFGKAVNSKTKFRLLIWAALLLASFAGNCFAQRPNIILINFDDADSEMFELSYSDQLYPNIMGVARSGITFTNLHATTPYCGPSRACLYRAQYAHNTKIHINDPASRQSNNFSGGMEFYRLQGYFLNDLSVWMKNAGYRTMMIGKFLHHDFEAIVPPGWDDFHFYLGARYYDTWRFSNEDNPQGSFDRLIPGAYRTDEETRDVVRTLERHAAERGTQPFFLNVNPFGPHDPAPDTGGMVATQKLHWWVNARPPFTRAFNEVEFSDKRGYFRGLPPLRPGSIEYTKTLYRDRALSMSSCDDMVGEIRRTLERLDMADNTYILITSDNGHSNGHHRMIGKGTPTDRSSRVPLIVMGPGVPANRTADHLMAHIDLGPTIVSLAKGRTPEFVDGRSFANLLTPTGIDDNPVFRNSVLIENWAQFRIFGNTAESASTTLRTVDRVYTEWANGDKDFFDLKVDPQQLDNSYDDLHPIIQDFYASWLRIQKNPNQKSNARFTVPFEHREQIPAGQSLRGLAEDPKGVEHVRLSIYDVDGKRYWNGSSWQTNFVQVNADLENPKGQITFWNFESMPDGSDVATGDMVAWVWSYDRNFDHANPRLTVFRN